MTPLISQFEKFLCANIYAGWLIVIGIALGLAFVIKLIINLVSKKLHPLALKTPTIWDTVFLEMLEKIQIFVLFFWLFYLFSKSLQTTGFVEKMLNVGLILLTALQVVIWGMHLLKNWYTDVLEKKMHKDPSASGALGLTYRFIQVAFILLIVLIAMSNLGINVGALLAGLGVGGIAVALAAQNVLGDLLASLSIVLDKPFCVGDYIITGNERGTVEQIGIKTTRLRSLSGEELIISNKNILDSRVQNFKRMNQRRILQTFSIVYSTPPDVVEMIPTWVKKIFDEEKKLKFERCNFVHFGASALEFEIVFYVLDKDYVVYAALQQRALLKMLKKFKEEGVSFAFPSHSVYLEKDQ